MNEHTASRSPVSLATRIRGEYEEMPGLSITLQQASRLWQIDVGTCETILADLVDAGFLRRTRNGAFILTSSESRQDRFPE
jgi:hypothetical protein